MVRARTMEPSVRTTRLAAGATTLVAATLLLVGLGSFGIWDPWELASADVARHLADGEPSTDEGAVRGGPLTPWLVAQGFALFGAHEWSGRLPVALMGLFAVLLAGWTIARFAGVRAGLYASLITLTSPLFLFNARQMIGHAPAMAAQALLFTCGTSLWHAAETGDGDGPPRSRAIPFAWALGFVMAFALSTAASGVMQGPLPVLAALAATALARGELERARFAAAPLRAGMAAALVLLTAVLAAKVVATVAANADAYSAWNGGAPRGGNPPTFEHGLEQVFHAFAPWTALLPLAFAHAFTPREGDDARPHERAVGLTLALWAVFGFAAQTVFISRYGTTTFLPVVALAGGVALWIRDVERDGRGSWGAGIVALLLSLLLVRDYRGYPASPAAGLGLTDLTAPEVFNPIGAWAALLGLFGAAAMLGLSVNKQESFAAFHADRTLADAPWAQHWPTPARTLAGALLLGWPRALIAAQWKRGLGFRAWTLLGALVASTCTVFGALCFALPEARPLDALRVMAPVALATAAAHALAGIVLAVRKARGRSVPAWGAPLTLGMFVGGLSLGIAASILSQAGLSSLVVRIGRVLALLVPALVLGGAAARTVRVGFHRLGEWSLVPMLAAGLAFGGYTALRFQPQMSAHFSPRDVYDAYNRLSGDGEPLGEYQVGGRAAVYYADGPVQELADQSATLAFLAGTGRVWLAFRADELAQLDRAYRQQAGRHLFVADASSARVLLATNQPIEGREDQNYLAHAILDTPPTPQHPLGIDFDHRVELLGYDLDLPNGSSVGPGQAFTVTWYWRVQTPVTGGYQIFLHIDGEGQRLNGDHEPVDGHYPVRLWDEGDIVVDRQELRVPANYPPGAYTFFIGFYAGDNRLDIVRGPSDDADRARAGILTVR